MIEKTNFLINKKIINYDSNPYCIAEAGINHNGELSLAKKMIEVAKEVGADAIKFQTFKAHELCQDERQQFTYTSQGESVTESMLSMFKRYEFSIEEWKILKLHSETVGINFFSTPQNISDLCLLLEIGVSLIKVGSDDFTNIPLLKYYAKSNIPIILSCGMSNLSEVHQALDAVGWFQGYPVALLLCTSEYPTTATGVNINKITTLRNAFPGLLVGFSDHTQGDIAASLAVAKGAKIFEKHFTLDNGLPGPDHWFSENPIGLKKWIETIKISDQMLGSEFILPTKVELLNKKEFQRIIVSAVDIKAGDLFTEENLTTRRVSGGQGLSPNLYSILLGKKAWRSFDRFEVVDI